MIFDKHRHAETIPFVIFQFFLLLSIFLVPIYLGVVYLWTFSVSTILLSTGFLVYWLSQIRLSKPLWVRTNIDFFIAFYVVAFSASFLFSQIPYRSSEEAYKLAAIILSFYATIHFCSRGQKTLILCRLIALFGGILSFVGLWQYLEGLPKDWGHIQWSLSSVYPNHNHFAGFLELVFPVSLGLAIAERNTTKKILYVFLCVLMGIAFIFTLSRGGYVSIFTGFLVLLILLVKKKKVLGNIWPVIMTVAFLAVGASFLLGWGPVGASLGTVARIIKGDVSLAGNRLFVWVGAWAMIGQYPWFGSGPGTFEFSFLRYRPEGFIGRPVFAHDDFLNLQGDCGMIAFFAAALLFLAIIRHGLRIIHQDDNRFRICVEAGCIAAIAALSVHSLVDFNFHIPANWMWAAIFAGLLMSLDRSRRFFSLRLDYLVRAVVIGVILTIIFAALFFGLSDFFLVRAKTVMDVDQSLRINPFNDRAYYFRGILKEVAIEKNAQSAMADFEKAVQINRLEPYYDYHRAMNYLAIHPDNPDEAVLLYRSALEKDPLDPTLCYLAASDLLGANQHHDRSVEDFAKGLFDRAVKLDPSYSGAVFEALWQYEGRPATLEEFENKVGRQSGAILWFFRKNHQWKEYRKYFLESLGVDSERKYKILGSASWADHDIQSFQLEEFSNEQKQSYEIFQGEYFYSNGEIEKKINVQKSPARLAIYAKGLLVGKSFPMIVMKLDDEVVDCLYIDGPHYTHFYSLLETTPGIHRLSFEHINEGNGEAPLTDRIFWIQKIIIQYSGGS